MVHSVILTTLTLLLVLRVTQELGCSWDTWDGKYKAMYICVATCGWVCACVNVWSYACMHAYLWLYGWVGVVCYSSYLETSSYVSPVVDSKLFWKGYEVGRCLCFFCPCSIWAAFLLLWNTTFIIAKPEGKCNVLPPICAPVVICHDVAAHPNLLLPVFHFGGYNPKYSLCQVFTLCVLSFIYSLKMISWNSDFQVQKKAFQNLP